MYVAVTEDRLFLCFSFLLLHVSNVVSVCSMGCNCVVRVRHGYAATRVFYMVQGDHHERLAVTLNLCLTNGAGVSKIWACLVIEFTDNVKVNDPHEQALCFPLAACLSFVLQYL